MSMHGIRSSQASQSAQLPSAMRHEPHSSLTEASTSNSSPKDNSPVKSGISNNRQQRHSIPAESVTSHASNAAGSSSQMKPSSPAEPSNISLADDVITDNSSIAGPSDSSQSSFYGLAEPSTNGHRGYDRFAQPSESPIRCCAVADAHKTAQPGTSTPAIHSSLAEPGASSNRLWMLADGDRAAQYGAAVQHAVAGAGHGAVCITSGAGAWLILMAAACESLQQIICLQVCLANFCLICSQLLLTSFAGEFKAGVCKPATLPLYARYMAHTVRQRTIVACDVAYMRVLPAIVPLVCFQPVSHLEPGRRIITML